MLATPEDETAGTMSFSNLTDAVEVATKQWNAFIVQPLFVFLMVILLLKRSEYFASISILLITEKFLAAIPYSYGYELQNECFRIKNETTRQCAFSVIATEH
jgi:hypothetical protein